MASSVTCIDGHGVCGGGPKGENIGNGRMSGSHEMGDLEPYSPFSFLKRDLFSFH
jgi:hypothetical protein